MSITNVVFKGPFPTPLKLRHSYSRLAPVIYTNVIFTDVILDETSSFTNAELNNVHFIRVRMNNCGFYHATLRNVHFIDVALAASDCLADYFYYAHLERTDTSGITHNTAVAPSCFDLDEREAGIFLNGIKIPDIYTAGTVMIGDITITKDGRGRITAQRGKRTETVKDGEHAAGSF